MKNKEIKTDRLGVTPEFVSQLKRRIRPIPLDRCVSIEQATDGEVSRKDLRPDDWHLIWPELAGPKQGRRAMDKG